MEMNPMKMIHPRMLDLFTALNRRTLEALADGANSSKSKPGNFIMVFIIFSGFHARLRQLFGGGY